MPRGKKISIVWDGCDLRPILGSPGEWIRTKEKRGFARGLAAWNFRIPGEERPGHKRAKQFGSQANYQEANL